MTFLQFPLSYCIYKYYEHLHMKKALILSFFLLTFISCSKEQSSLIMNYSEESYTIPLSTAIESLNDVLNGLNSVPGTKCATPDTRFSIDVFGGLSITSTKAIGLDISIPDTLMYLVNFDDTQGGFAVLAGDSRLGESVYCVTESGNIDVEDFAQAFDFLHSRTTKANDIDSDSFIDIGPKFVPALLLSSMLADLKYGSVLETETKSSAITTSSVLLKTKWTQSSPFNTYTFDDDGVRSPVGCVALACAQIMQYCQQPTNPTFDGVSCSWDDMGTVYSSDHIDDQHCTESAKEQVARFLKHIGQRSLCNIRYAPDGSTGYAAGVVRTLEYYDYRDVKKRTGFGSTNQSKASAMLAQKKPVYLDGSDYHNGGGHAWVIDGEWNGYFHCNWGWGGAADGFYAKHNYFPISSRAYYEQGTDPGTSISDASTTNYDWNFRIVTYSYTK